MRKLKPQSIGQCVSFFCFAFLCLATSFASAQSRYVPSRPPLSPWLNLYRGNLGPVDPYNFWVRPQLEFQDSMRRLSTQFENQRIRVQQLEQETLRMRLEAARPTGVGARFMDYSHYFFGQGSPTVRPTQRPSRVTLGGRSSSAADRYKHSVF